MFKAEEVFFFDQNNPKRFETRRARKLLDDIYSISGERREGVTIRLGEKEVADSASVVTAHSLGRKISVVGYGVRLPQIDPQGPNFIRGNQSIAEENREVETKSILSEKRFELLKEVEEELSTTKQEAAHKPASIWEVSEAKFASSGILSKLGKLLEDVCTKVIEVTLPADLLEDLSRNYKELTADVVVEKREWQTDCYDDYRSSNAFPFLTGHPDKLQKQVNKSALKNLVAQEEQVKKSRKIFGRKDNNNSSNFKTEKRVRMSREAKGDGRSVGFKTTPTPERPQTARSNISNYSYRSDCSDDGRDSYMATEYDRLPPELRPTILHYRRESTSLKMNKPLTRMEKAQEVKKKNAAERFRNVRTKLSVVTMDKGTSPGRKVSMSARPKSGDDFIGGVQIPKTVIAFSIAGAHQSNEDNQAWLVHPSDTADPEAHTLRMWDKKLKELHRTMEEAKHLDKKKGADKALVVKFYNDPQLRTLRMKHQRSSTVPLPAVFSKLPPSIGTISPPAANEVLLLGEGVKTFVLTLPDGSGYCRYPSGNLAVSLSRCDMDGPLGSHKGLYTLIFDDCCEGSPLLGYFTPLGKACCYHKNGVIKMFSDSKGGCLYNEKGEVTRKWEWPPIRMSMPVSVHLHLNVHISVRCSSLTNMDLRVSMRSQSYKFAIGSSAEDMLDHLDYAGDLSAGNMSSLVPFASQAAHSRRKTTTEELLLPSSRGNKSMKSNLKKKRHDSSADDEGTTVSDSLSTLLSESDKYTDILSNFRKTLCSVVDKWMDHYCTTLGVRVESVSRIILPTRGRDRGRGASETRLVKSSLGYVSSTYYSRPPSHVRLARSMTHPLNSRASSRPVSTTPTADPMKFPSVTGASEEGDSKPKDSTTKLSFSQNWMSSSAMLLGPSSKTSVQLKGVSSKSKSSHRTRTIVGCPVALHKMMEEKLPALPQCKCAKHFVPFIFDTEFDRFLKEYIPRHQLVVICVKSSLKESSCPCEPLVDSIYCDLNRARFSPCLLANQDQFRLFKYDLIQPLKGKDNPMLVERHNVSAGMFMMYMNGNLVHADHVFNGYSNTKGDFMKQIDYSIRKGRKGQFLPSDFKFTRHTGTRILRSNTWAYPVSGIMHDLIHSPESGSGVSTPQKHSQSQTISEIFLRSHATSEGLDGQDDDDYDGDESLQYSSTSLVPPISTPISTPSRTKLSGLRHSRNTMNFSIKS